MAPMFDARRSGSRWSPEGVRGWSLAPLLALLLAPACNDDGDDEPPEADEYFYDCMSAPAAVKIYATDESFRAIVDKESAGAALPDDTRAATLLTPSTGTPLSISTPPTFTISIPGSAEVRRHHPEPTDRKTRLSPATAPAAPRLRRSLARRLGQWLSPIGTAHAHCGNVSGNNTLLRLERAGERRPAYTALVSVESFSPSAAVWQRAMAGRKGQTLRASLMRAVLADGRVDEGPFISRQAISFPVGD